jgi:D-glycero-alpha-D-manno-heptose 1-phosphate guanylyltransferase
VQMIDTAIVLAGGLGTRLRDVVSAVPKSMAPINGRPFLEYQLDYLISYGLKNFVLAVGYLNEKIINHFGTCYRGASIDYSIENLPLGTGGALSLALKHMEFGSDFLVLNGDTFFNIDLMQMVCKHESNMSAWTFAVFKSDDANRYTAITASETGQVTSFENKSKEKSFFVNGGIYLTNRDFVSSILPPVLISQSLEIDIFPSMLSNDSKVFIYQSDAKFIDIGIPKDYERADDLIGRGE